MVVSMGVSGRHGGSARPAVDEYVSERYEHFSAEQESDDIDDFSPGQNHDNITPIANDPTLADGGSTTRTDVSAPQPPKAENEQQDHKNQLRNVSIRFPGLSNTSFTSDGYFSSHPHRSLPSSRRAIGGPGAPSTQSSSGSLHALSEHEGIDAIQASVRRTTSNKTNPYSSRVRSPSQPKTNSPSPVASKRMTNKNQPVYPDQSFASLQIHTTSTRPPPVLRTRSSHPAQNILYNDMSRISKAHGNGGPQTADNTPLSSPGLYSPSSSRNASMSDSRLAGSHLHHLQAPKETHLAEIEHDVFSGNKLINNYEVVGELGRGEHGKVKLGRDMDRNSHMVAIKIVPRYSARRRLGKLGEPEDRTKREVAILKKARHPNVVSLLEVIDDPAKNKVYLILEFVEKGEIKWRKHGVKEILAINYQRFEQEKKGIIHGIEPTDRESHIVHLAQVKHERLEQMKKYNQGFSHAPNWSLEYAGETDDESEMFEFQRSLSRQLSQVNSPIRGNSQDDFNNLSTEASLSGSMYGSYMPEAYRNRKFSVAASAVSHMSSEINFDQDDDQRAFVPAMTLEEARCSFRDTLLGLEFLHFMGIIHRDIKPANLLVSSSGAVKISDFGVSYLGRPITEAEADKETHESDAMPLDNEKELAKSVGTPAFWGPELCYDTTDMFADKKEPKINGALDLWALGITLYCMIYARLPFYHDEHMGIHEAVCTSEVFCPRTRLVPVDTTSSEPVTRPTHSINSNKRLDYELKFEFVPDSLRDLIEKLLIKDPAHRITITEAKEHPWVTEGVSNTEILLQNPEINKESKKKILEMSDKEIDRAVVKRNIIERLSNTAGRMIGSLLGRKDSQKDTRKRASTNASSAGSSTESLQSPAGSSTSTVGKQEKAREPRRASLRGDELVQALKASRDPHEHHPLAQSQTASPDDDGTPEVASLGYFDHRMKAASAGATPGVDMDRHNRPRGPDRAVSALSTADSIKTIRPSYHQRSLIADSIGNLEQHNSEPTLRARVEGLWEGTTKTLTRLASRDRRRTSSRSRSRSRPSSDQDGHAGPSVAVSNAHAAGAFQTPEVLRPAATAIEEPPVVSISNQIETPHHSPFRVPSSDHLAFEQARQINQRRQIQEALSRVNVSPTIEQPTLESHADSCPPSPDDLTFVDRSARASTQISPSEMQMGTISTTVSVSTMASSVDGYGNSSVSQSVSNPSIGITSGSSSPPGDNYITDDHKPDRHRYNLSSTEVPSDIMRTADTVTFHGRPATPTASGKPLQAEQEYYDDGDDESDFSDEEGIVMGGLRNR